MNYGCTQLLGEFHKHNVKQTIPETKLLVLPGFRLYKNVKRLYGVMIVKKPLSLSEWLGQEWKK